MDSGALVQILQATLSNEASTRRAAESSFMSTWVPQPNHLYPTLLSIMQNSALPEEVRCTAAVFFRRWISRSVTEGSGEEDSSAALFHLADPKAVQTGLLTAFTSCDSKLVRKRLADAIGQVASLISRYEEWQELVQLTISSLQQDDFDFIAALLRIVTANPDLFSNLDSAHVSQLVRMIQGKTTPAIAVEAVACLTSLAIFFYPDDNRRGCFVSVLEESYLFALLQAAQADSSIAVQLWTSAADLVFECPRLFASKKQGSALLGKYLTLAASVLHSVPAEDYGTDDKGVASAALEFVCAAVEGSPGTFKRERALLEASAVLLLQVTGMEDGSDDWLTTDPTDEEDVTSLSVLGQQSLDRFALALGGVAAGSVIYSHITQMLKGASGSGDWRGPFAALMGIASTAEGCAEGFLEDGLASLLEMIWPLFGHSHPRVQYACCHALGQLCTDFPGRIQAEAAPAALTALVGLLSKSSPAAPARVQCHAAAALVNFAEGCEAHSIAPFLDGILSVLAGILATPQLPPYLVEQLLATIAAYSGAAQDRFASFYDRLMPLLLAGLNAQSRKVQCRAVEAVSLVMTAVKTSPQSAASLQATLPGFLDHLRALEGQMTAAPADDPIREFLPSAWLRMAQLMGAGFATLLPVILPGIIRVIASDAFSEADEAVEGGDENGDEDSPIEVVRVGGKNVGINTAILADKASALETLAALIPAVGPGAFPDPLGIFRMTLQLINFEWSGEVRAAAVECSVAALENHFKSTNSGQEEVKQLISVILEGLSELYEADFGMAALDALSSLFASFKTDIPVEALHSLNELLPKLLELVLENLAQMEANPSAANGEEDEDEEEGGFVDSADEEEVLYAWGRLQATLYEIYPQAIPIHSWSLAFIHKRFTAKPSGKKQKLPSSGLNEAFGHAAMGVLCDWMVWTGEAGALPYGQQLIDVIGVAMVNPSPLIKQAAVHLCGLMASRGGAAFRDYCVQVAAPLLVKLVGRPDCQAPSQATITDNAVSSLIRIHRAFPLASSDGVLISTMLMPGLPVMSDEAEIKPVLEFIAGAWNPQAEWASEVRARLQRMKHQSNRHNELLQKFLN